MYSLLNKAGKWYYMNWDDVAECRTQSKSVEEYVCRINDAEHEVGNIKACLVGLIMEAKNADIIYMLELNKHYKHIIPILNELGYHHTKEYKPTKIKSKEFSTLVAMQTGIGSRCYYLKIRVNAKKIVYIYGLDNVITEKPEDVFESYRQDTTNLSYSYLRAIHLLNKKVESVTGRKIRKYPTTITAYSNKCRQVLTRHDEIQPIPLDTIPEELYVKDALGRNTSDSIDWFSNAYHGGIIYKRHSDKVFKIFNVVVFDYNSLFPCAMKKPLPFGRPEYVKGQPSETDFKNVREGKMCMWLRIEVELKLKDKGIPFLQRNKRMFNDSDCDLWEIRTKKGFSENIVEGKFELTLCYPDYYCMILNYDIFSLTFLDYCVSPAKTTIFSKYVDLFYNDKVKQTGAQKHTTKRLLNVNYGALCKSRTNYNINDFDSNIPEAVKSDISYIHIGGYITSWARYIWLNYVNNGHYDDIYYGDTDSYHTDVDLFDLKLGEGLGELKIEHVADVGIYYKKKCYMLLDYGKDKTIEVNITKAGTDKDSIHILECLIESLYHAPYDVELIRAKCHEKWQDEEGYDAEKVNKLIDDILHITQTEEYELLYDVEIPVWYRKDTEPFYYKWVLHWEKFSHSILDEY